ncbi:hypothetical protein LCGC14_0997330 [marine sediment metagenome]|uniref:Uncharacterized protein n=1 Tax=marine sediment metagenome TaxID=412755 RepID=A0A0F9QMJ9_9ZZZZ|nr:hypothetical protein [Methylophaga sp.]HEC58919.1 hypothetical protein [Methylophaga sp.]
MNNIFDDHFEAKRLERLRIQCLSNVNISGEIIFAAMDDNLPYINQSAWMFQNNDNQILSDSGYKYYMLSMLDIFAEYRSQFEGLECRGGVVSLKNSASVIVWMPQIEVLALIK